LEGADVATFIAVLSRETTSDQEILVNDSLVEELFGPQPDQAAQKRARKRLYRLITEVAPQHRLPCFKDESGQWACRRATVKAYQAARQLWLGEQEQRAFSAFGLATADVGKSDRPGGVDARRTSCLRRAARGGAPAVSRFLPTQD
jgi:hypothetical protein